MIEELTIESANLCPSVEPSDSPLWSSALGQRIVALEELALTPFIRRLHGDVVLWSGDHVDSLGNLQQLMVRHCVFVQQRGVQGHTEMPSLGAALEAIPLRNRSVDGIVLHHALELTHDPRIALREVTRVLAPGGQLIICGFNPWSLLGLRALYARLFSDALSARRIINPLRLFDWLTLLGFELDRPPLYTGVGVPSTRLQERLDMPRLRHWGQGMNHPPSRLPFGGILVISAVKQAVSGRMQLRRRNESRKLAPVAYPAVASWRKTRT